MPLKPFNPQAALNGEKVIAKDGTEITQIKEYILPNKHVVCGIIKDAISCWYFDSGININGFERYNLFMAPKIREGWINIYPPYDDDSNSYVANGSDVFTSKEIADEACNPNRRIACIRIEWEE